MDTSDNDYATITILIEDNKRYIEISVDGNNFNENQQQILNIAENFGYFKKILPRSGRTTIKYQLINKDSYQDLRDFIHSLPEHNNIKINDNAFRLEQGRTARATAAATASAFADEFAGISGLGDVETAKKKESDLEFAKNMLDYPIAPLIPGISQRDPDTGKWLPRGYNKKGEPYYGGKRTKRRRGKKSRKGKSKKRYSRRR